ncbi:MAG TPA: hypothetical protein VKE51_11340, partial [Vicinamibacterales bacterium]|nr:hypothetical protein [Vicinamibacterales bacterium]
CDDDRNQIESRAIPVAPERSGEGDRVSGKRITPWCHPVAQIDGDPGACAKDRRTQDQRLIDGAGVAMHL